MCNNNASLFDYKIIGTYKLMTVFFSNTFSSLTYVLTGLQHITPFQTSDFTEIY